MKADELWDKHASDTDGVRFLMRQDDFLAALTEYGEAVRAEAVKVCEKYDTQSHDNLIELAVDDLKKMELP